MILITGASGFLGKELIKVLAKEEIVVDKMTVGLTRKIRVLSRNEGKLIELKQQYPHIEIMTGCISDETICKRALKDVDKVYHLAAFKHVGQAETQPYQCVNSNLIGTINLLKHFKGKDFIAISTDKASQVNGVYGASKYLMEQVIREFEIINEDINYRVVRYGNVLYSTGSVLCKWKDALLNGGKIIVTEPTATRFFWTVDQAIQLIFDCEKNANSSKPYCPEMKSMSVKDLMYAMIEKYGNGNLTAIEEQIYYIGLQAGENLHETIIEGGVSSEFAEKFTIDEIIELI
jgi:UDP-N-acetylglucosamine 4,6-dehydratase/UDP-glucose 4-epimerase